MNWRGTGVALVAALAGAGIASVLGIPAGALLGSTIAVTAAALVRLGPSVPDRLRDVGFCAIGVTLGSGVTPSILNDLARWPLSIFMLAVTVVVIMISMSILLRCWFGTDAQSALLATSPGALSYTLSLAVDRNADLRFVMVMQSFRILLVIVVLPPLIGVAGEGETGRAGNALQYVAYAQGFILLALTFATGWGLTRLRTPAAYLLAGLVVSATAHAAGFVSGGLHAPVTFAAFAIAGAVVGTRFGGITGSELRRLGMAGLVTTAVAVVLSAAMSYLIAEMLGYSFGQVWVAFAPGGVEAMSSMALALGYDPVYVATHHIFRILLLVAILPFMIRIFAPRRAGRD